MTVSRNGLIESLESLEFIMGMLWWSNGMRAMMPALADEPQYNFGSASYHSRVTSIRCQRQTLITLRSASPIPPALTSARTANRSLPK
jgi:hypothetical protein